MEENGISFNAELKKISTTIDGGWTITLAISQDDANEVLALSQYRDQLLSIGIIPIKKED